MNKTSPTWSERCTLSLSPTRLFILSNKFSVSQSGCLYEHLNYHAALLSTVTSRSNSSTSLMHADLLIMLVACLSHLGKQFLLLSEELFLWDAQVFQSRAGLPSFQGYGFTLLQDIFHLCDVRCETEALERCGLKARGESVLITLCGFKTDTPLLSSSPFPTNTYSPE